MNFGEKEDFFERHRYFFQDYSFKFEGLTAEKQNELVDIVKKLSGDVSNDADYRLCESSYFKKEKKNKIHDDYYSVDFISHCISKNMLLDINEYKFRDGKENFNDNIQIVIDNNRVYTEVEEIKENCLKENKKNVESKNKNSFTKKEKFNVPFKNWRKRKAVTIEKCEKEISIKIKEKEIEVIDLSSDESDEVPAKINISPKNLKILDPLSINTKFKINGKERKNALVQSSEEAGPSFQNKATIEDLIDTYEDVIQGKPSVSTPKSVISNPSSPLSTSSESLSSDDDNDDNDDNDDDDDDDDVDKDNVDKDSNKEGIVLLRSNKWWQKLPSPSFSTKVHSKNIRRGRRGAKFSASEQRTMIAFLIKYKLIYGYSGSSRAPWEEMHQKGYLLHRTVESLSNNYRRSILPNIKAFKLPKKYEKIFLLTRR